MPQSEKQTMIYIRSATAGATASSALALQEDQCCAFAKAAGYKVAQIFKDEGYSGNMIERPALGAMIDALSQATVPHAVIVLERGRLTHNSREWATVISTFKDLKAELLIVREGGNPVPLNATIEELARGQEY